MVDETQKIMKLMLTVSLIFCNLCVITIEPSAASNTKILDNLEDLIRRQSDLLTSFEYLLHKTPTNTNEEIDFMNGFEDLVRRQANLTSQFAQLLSAHWDEMDIDAQEKFLDSFADLNSRESVLISSFKDLCDGSWSSFSPETKAKFLTSLDDLSRRMANLLLDYEMLFKKRSGGLFIFKSLNQEVIQNGEFVIYNYTVKNLYSNKDLVNITIVDDKLGTIVDDISLLPGESRFFTKEVALSQSTCNKAKAIGKAINKAIFNKENKTIAQDLEDTIVSDESNTVCALVRRGGLPEPVDYGQFSDNQKVVGTGQIEVSSSIKDKQLALDYQNNYAGNGSIELNSERRLSGNASQLKRLVDNVTIPLNFFEKTTFKYSGANPIAGEKRLVSKGFWGGIGAEIGETFSAANMEKSQTAFLATTDPTSGIANYTAAMQLSNISSAHLVGLDTAAFFNGTWGTIARWHQSFRKDIMAQQQYSGKFEIEKLMKFNENPKPKQLHDYCRGIDC